MKKWVTLAFLCLAFFFYMSDRQLFGLLVPLIQEDTGMSKLQIGLIDTAMYWVLALAMPFSGFAVELGCLGIRANAILAGAVRTDRWDGLSEEEVAKRRARWPVGRESTPEQIADAVAFLCSDAAGTISGAEIPVDSGIGACLLAYNKDWIKNDPYNVKYWEKK